MRVYILGAGASHHAGYPLASQLGPALKTWASDPECPNEGTFANALILPTHSKNFYFETSFGKEWIPFWDSIWKQAEGALRQADEILVLGYSLPSADERAANMILNTPRRDSKVTIVCHGDSTKIEQRFKEKAFKHVSALEMKFEDWVCNEQVAGRKLGGGRGYLIDSGPK